MTLTELKRSAASISSVSELFFQLGFNGVCLPRKLRRVLAGSKLHRYWMSGFYGGGIIGVEERFEGPSAIKRIKY